MEEMNRHRRLMIPASLLPKPERSSTPMQNEPATQVSFLPELTQAPAPVEGSLNIANDIRYTLNQTFKHCPLSRYQIAGRMSETLDREITKAQLDAYTAESKDGYRFPAEYIPAFIDATGNNSLIKVISQHCAGYFIENEDALKLELGRIADEERHLRERRKAIQTFLSRGIQ